MATIGVAKSIVTKAITAADGFLKDQSEFISEKLTFTQDEDATRLKIHDQGSKVNTYIEISESHLAALEKKLEKLEELVGEDIDSISDYFQRTEDARNRLEAARMKLKEKMFIIQSQKDITYRTMSMRMQLQRSEQPAAEPPTIPEHFLTLLERHNHPGRQTQPLPVIPMPKFSGDAWEFKRFWFGFSQLVDEKEELTPYEKLVYLRSSLRHEALRLVNTVPDQENSYEEAVNILKKKYDDKHAVTHQLHNRIRNIRMKDNTPRSARYMLEMLQQLVPRLTEYGDQTDNRSFLTDILRKFPEHIRGKTLEKIIDSDREQPWKWETISEFLGKVIERTELVNSEREVFRTEDNHLTSQNSRGEIRQPFRAENRQRKRDDSVHCFLCDKRNHRSEECRKVPFDMRRSTMLEKQLCLRCGVTGDNHDYRSCRRTCTECNGGHHAALCYKQQPRQMTNSGNGNGPANGNRFPPQGQTNNSRGSYQQEGGQNYQQRHSNDQRMESGPRQPERTNHSSPRDNRQPQQNRPRPQNQQQQSRAPQQGGYRFQRNENVNVIAPVEPPIFPPTDIAHVEAQGGTLLTGLVPIMSEGREPKKARTIFDSGSTTSFIDQELVKELNLPIVEHRSITLQTFGQHVTEKRYPIAKLRILDLDNCYTELTPICVPTTFFSKTTIHSVSKEDQDKIEVFRVPMCDTNYEEREEKIQLLLGCDCMWSFLCGADRGTLELSSGLILVPSSFRYLRSGGTNRRSPPIIVNTILDVTHPAAMSSSEQFWMTETLATDEISDQFIRESELRQRVNDKIREEFELTTRRVDGRYYISFPKREERIEKLSRNENMAFKRLCHLYSSYHDNAWLIEMIKTNFQEQMERGVIERVKFDEIRDPRNTFYAPFHPVVSMEKESTKVRVVFDASAHEKGKMSLNEVLHQGPNTLPQLTGVVMRSRISKYLVSADVEKAFLQVKLNEFDKDLTRFLLPEDWSKPPSATNIAHYRHTVLPFGINCSPFLLGAVLQLHLDQGNGGAARDDLANQMYVDNVFICAESELEADWKIRDSLSFFDEMKMNLRQFTSNAPSILDQVAPEKMSSNENPKLLGIAWNTRMDTLSVRVNFEPTTQLTRRIVSRQIASIFDPMGLAAPLTLKMKLFLQKLFTNKDQKWDQRLTDGEHEEWNQLLNEVSDATIGVPRHVGSSSHQQSQLVIFTDASTTSYGACAYVITEGQSHLIMSRTKLAPLRSKATVPKLELLALTLGFRLALHILPELRKGPHIALHRSVHVLSDSTAALGWLNMDMSTLRSKKLGILIYNRIQEIHRISNSLDEFHDFFAQHVATDQNPADHCSRGLTEAQMVISNWLTGPNFLLDNPEQWPERESRFQIPRWDTTRENENNKSYGSDSTLEEVMVVQQRKRQLEDSCINWTNGVNSQGSTDQPTRLTRLFKAGALICRFFKKCLRKNAGLRSRLEAKIPEIQKISSDGPLSATDVIQGRNLLMKIQQQETFANLSSKELYKAYAAVHDEDGLLRVEGRIGKSGMPSDTQRPILVSGKHPISELIVEHFHRKSMHFGTAHTLAAIRSQYWMTKPRALINRILAECRPCRLMNRRPLGYPNAPDLPRRRLIATRPFEHVGLDYLGPLTTREAKDTEPQKRWIILVTCLTTRALYLDLVSDLSTIGFIAALRRFFARYGIPTSITSDNAPQFHLGERILNNILSSTGNSANQVQRFMAEQQIKWHFISAFAPWQGGVYERMCGSIKNALYKVLRRTRPTFEELRTILSEIEAALNLRPLTYVDNSDDWLLLTPGHFLAQGVRLVIPRVILSAEDETYLPPNELQALETRQAALSTLWMSQEHSKKIWEDFQNSYLTSLAESNRSRRKFKHEPRQPLVGEIVMVKDAIRPRYAWPLAKVVETMKGADGALRNVRLKTGRGKEITRPVSILIPLELSDEIQEAEECYAPARQEICRRYNLRPRVSRQVQDQPALDLDDSADEEELVSHIVAHNGQKWSSLYPIFVDDDVNSNLTEEMRERIPRRQTREHEQRVESVHCLQANTDFILRFPAKERTPMQKSGAESTGIDIRTARRRRNHKRQTQETFAKVPEKPHLLLLPMKDNPRTDTGCERNIARRMTREYLVTMMMLLGVLISSGNAHEFACIPGGLTWQNVSSDELTICAKDFCVEANRMDQYMLLPPAVTSEQHQVTIKHQEDDREVSITRLTCPAISNFCDHIQCTFCVDNIANPECHPRSVTIITIFTIYMALTLMVIFCMTPFQPASVLFGAIRLTVLPIRIVGKILRRTIHVCSKNRGRKRKGSNTSLVLLKIVATCVFSMSAALACDHISLLDSDLMRCAPNGICRSTHVQSISFTPTQPVACIHATMNETAVFHARLEWKTTSLRCVKNSNTFTRSVKHFVASSKRCAHTGSCTPGFCGTVQTDTRIEELGTHNNAPGRTHCVESAGFIGGGCFFPSPGCLFWRETLEPNDDAIYEIFHCSSWIATATVAIDIAVNNRSEYYELPLVVGRPKPLGDHQVSIVNIQRNEYPILNSHFMTDGTTTAILDTSDEIHLWCNSVEEAEKGRCVATPNCACQPADTTMNCDCKSTNLSETLRDTSKVLPIHQPSLLLHNNNATVIGSVETTGTLVIEWNWNLSQFVERTESHECTMKISTLNGCYACREGARAFVGCRSKKPTTAVLECGNQLITAYCGPEEPITNASFFWDYARVNILCKSSCNPTEIALTGTLRYHAPSQGLLQAMQWSDNRHEIALPDLNHLLNSVAQYIGMRVIFIMVIATLGFVIYIYMRGTTMWNVMLHGRLPPPEKLHVL